AALYAVAVRVRGPRLRPAASCEAVFLLGLVAACVPVGPALVPPRVVAGASADEAAQEPRLVWTFALPARGAIVSSPLVHGGRVYVAAAHDDVFRPYGRLYCLDRDTGKVAWTFDDGKKMKQAFSSPVVAGGSLYIGEGLHQDEGCKLYALDPATGAKRLEFTTGSHTEATPVVAGGRVYQGAGDDGLYCLDGKLAKVWNFPGFHIDAGPAVEGDGVFVGSGVGDAFKETAIFRLDAATGKVVWRVPTELPVWTEVLVSGGRVYAGMGNGRLNEEPERPTGLVVALDAKTGNEVWRVRLKDGVLGRIALDGSRLYVGCRDGSFYCLRRRDGSVAWSRDVGGPVVAGAALDRDGEETPERLYVTAVGGPLTCLEPAGGRVLWAKALGDGLTQVEAIATPALEVRGGARRLYVAVTLTSAARLGELRCYEE
ncbi:MAG: PQQ-binding-like beta-propeller repeat protein, partial [Gemmataceae bacterium]